VVQADSAAVPVDLADPQQASVDHLRAQAATPSVVAAAVPAKTSP
jgi:hypothetical protein